MRKLDLFMVVLCSTFAVAQCAPSKYTAKMVPFTPGSHVGIILDDTGTGFNAGGYSLTPDDCPSDIVKKIQCIEDRSDQCYRELTLLKLPWNVGVWAALTDSITVVDGSIPLRLRGSRHHLNTATNVELDEAISDSLIDLQKRRR